MKICSWSLSQVFGFESIPCDIYGLICAKGANKTGDTHKKQTIIGDKWLKTIFLTERVKNKRSNWSKNAYRIVSSDSSKTTLNSIMKRVEIRRRSFQWATSYYIRSKCRANSGKANPNSFFVRGFGFRFGEFVSFCRCERVWCLMCLNFYLKKMRCRSNRR